MPDAPGRAPPRRRPASAWVPGLGEGRRARLAVRRAAGVQERGRGQHEAKLRLADARWPDQLRHAAAGHAAAQAPRPAPAAGAAASGPGPTTLTLNLHVTVMVLPQGTPPRSATSSACSWRRGVGARPDNPDPKPACG